MNRPDPWAHMPQHQKEDVLRPLVVTLGRCSGATGIPQARANLPPYPKALHAVSAHCCMNGEGRSGAAVTAAASAQAACRPSR